jgi:hypothetical protein
MNMTPLTSVMRMRLNLKLMCMFREEELESPTNGGKAGRDVPPEPSVLALLPRCFFLNGLVPKQILQKTCVLR